MQQAIHIEGGSLGPRRISVSQGKGGVGKSITAVNLAMGLSLSGLNVLLLDADTQGHASYMLGESPEFGLNELVSGDCQVEDTLVQVRETLFLLGGGKSLAALKRLLGRSDFGGEVILADTLRAIDNNYDFVIIDSSSGWDALTVNIFFYVQEVLCPVTLDPLAFHSLAEYMKNIASIQKYSSSLTYKYTLPTFFDKGAKDSMTLLGELHKIYGSTVCSPIRQCENLAQSAYSGQSIFDYAPGAPGADDYRSLVRKVTKNDKLLR